MASAMNLPAYRHAADADSAMLRAIAERAGQADAHGQGLAAETALLREAGWLTRCLPPGENGDGWGCSPEGTEPAMAALRRLGRVSLPTARLFEGHMNAVKLVALYATPAGRTRAFARVREGAMLGVWGADDPADPVRLERDGDTLRLHGTKRFASGLGDIALAVVTAVAPGGGTQLLLVPVDEPERADPSGWRMAGMRATRSGAYRLDGLRVTADDLLGAPDDYYREPHFEGGIWRYCAAHLGGAEALYAATRDTLLARGRASDPHQETRIVAAAVAVETARLWIERAARAVEAADAPPDAMLLALLAREVTDGCCREVLGIVERALGMAAHEDGTAIERTRRDLSLFVCQAAPDAKRSRAARALVAVAALPEAW